MTRVLVTHASEFLGSALANSLVSAIPSATIFVQDSSFKTEKVRQGFLEGLAEPARSRVQFLPVETPKEICDAVDGQVDVLVNNTAYPAIRNKFQDIGNEEFVQCLNALTVFPFELTKLLLPKMLEEKKGKIIFLTSATVLRGLPNYASYVIARGATTTMGLTLAKEVANAGINVNVVAPNFIESETYFPKKLRDDLKLYAKMTKPIPLARLGKPHEAADFIAFLASEKANYITAQVFPFAGGWV